MDNTRQDLLVPGLLDEIVQRHIISRLLYEDIAMFELASRVHMNARLFTYSYTIGYCVTHTASHYELDWYRNKLQTLHFAVSELMNFDDEYNRNFGYRLKLSEISTYLSKCSATLKKNLRTLRGSLLWTDNQLWKSFVNLKGLRKLDLRIAIETGKDHSIVEDLIQSPMPQLEELFLSVEFDKEDVTCGPFLVPSVFVDCSIPSWKNYCPENHSALKRLRMNLKANDGSFPPNDAFPVIECIWHDNKHYSRDYMSSGHMNYEWETLLELVNSAANSRWIGFVCWYQEVPKLKGELMLDAQLYPLARSTIVRCIEIGCNVWIQFFKYRWSDYAMFMEQFKGIELDRCNLLRLLLSSVKLHIQLPIVETDFEYMELLPDIKVECFLAQLQFVICTDELAKVLFKSQRVWKYFMQYETVLKTEHKFTLRTNNAEDQNPNDTGKYSYLSPRQFIAKLMTLNKCDDLDELPEFADLTRNFNWIPWYCQRHCLNEEDTLWALLREKSADFRRILDSVTPDEQWIYLARSRLEHSYQFRETQRLLRKGKAPEYVRVK